MSTTEGMAVQRTIDVTDAGVSVYEQAILAQVTAPAESIARMEAERAAASHPSVREMLKMQLQQEAAQIEAAMALLQRAGRRYGLPPATMMRVGATGMRLAAMRITEAA